MSATKKTAKKGWQERFLAALAQDAYITGACKAAGVSRDMAYRTRNTDPKFAEAWEDALEQSIEALEQVARKRASDGSDTLVIFLLKAQRPHVYRERLTVDVDAEVARTLSQLAAFSQTGILGEVAGPITSDEGEDGGP